MKNNLITNEKIFTVKSRNEPLSKEKLFTIKDISKQKSNFHKIEVQSIISDLYVTSRFYIDEKSVNNVQIIQLINGKTIFKFPKTNKYKSKLTFHFLSVWENETHQELHVINRETTKSKLNIEINWNEKIQKNNSHII